MLLLIEPGAARRYGSDRNAHRKKASATVVAHDYRLRQELIMSVSLAPALPPTEVTEVTNAG
jgi:hypothetical protein